MTARTQFALAACVALAAQEKGPLFPQLSPSATVSQVVGTTQVEISYHRPAVRGRSIWGSLVPYGQVWRLGANEATTIRFTDPVMLRDKKVPAGTYALFAIPGPEHWTLILNRRARQTGAWEYDASQDVLRFEVKPKGVPNTEWLTFEIYPAGHGTAYIDLYWEKVRVSFLVEVDVDELVTARMRKAMQANPGDWKLFSDAALYCAEQEIHMGEALGWAEKSLKLNRNPQNLYAKARVLHTTGKVAEALQLLEQALQLATSRKLGPASTGPMEQTREQWKRNGN
jgi:hypothetical protein